MTPILRLYVRFAALVRERLQLARARSDHGQGTTEYIVLVLLIAAIAIAIQQAHIEDQIVTGIDKAVEKVLQSSSI